MGCHQFPFGFPYVGASFQKRGGQSQGKSVGQLYFFGQDVAVYGVGEITGQECDFAFFQGNPAFQVWYHGGRLGQFHFGLLEYDFGGQPALETDFCQAYALAPCFQRTAHDGQFVVQCH